MAKNKTTETEVKVSEFIESFVENDQKKADSYKLIELMTEWSGFEPKMWGPTIIGFGSYHYKYASGREGDWPLTGFSPRKQSMTLYIMPGFDRYEKLMEKLGKYKTGKSCLYINKLEDVNMVVLKDLVKGSVDYMNEKYNS